MAFEKHGAIEPGVTPEPDKVEKTACHPATLCSHKTGTPAGRFDSDLPKTAADAAAARLKARS